jgi:uncharacterized protein (UPF0332 family)
MRAVLALDNFDSKKHSGVIAAFRQHHIKTGEFSAFFSQIIKNAFDVRNRSDYDDFFIISKTDVMKQVANATTFLAGIEKYVKLKCDSE